MSDEDVFTAADQPDPTSGEAGTWAAARPGSSRREIGELDLLDLQLFIQRRGGDSLPYPFMLTGPTRFAFADELADYSAGLAERLRTGDLTVFSRCLDALGHAEVTVSAFVQHIPSTTPSIRVLAFRTGQAGYMFEQRPDADVLSISAISPFGIGAEVALAMALTKPGRHARIVIPEWAQPTPAAQSADDEVVIRHEVVGARVGTEVPVTQVSAYARLQSNWLPPRDWGIDPRKESLSWLRTIDDGEYLCGPNRSQCVPLSHAALVDRIDAVVEADMEMVRESRGEE